MYLTWCKNVVRTLKNNFQTSGLDINHAVAEEANFSVSSIVGRP